MDLIVALVIAAVFPVACLGFLLWMARFEDRLPDAVRRAARTPDPPPILAIPTQRTAGLRRPEEGGERARPEGPVRQSAMAPYNVDKSAAVSLGGSTNR